MKWLTIDYIKQHSRIDFDCEDSLLELYGESAEETVMKIIRRDYDDIVANFGTEKKPIPADIIHASLLLVDESYQHRTPITQQNVYMVPYAFDMMVKPYMRLADGCELVPTHTSVLGSQEKIEFSADLPDGMKLEDVDFTVDVINVSEDCPDKPKRKSYAKGECLDAGDGAYIVLIDTNDFGIGTLMLMLTVQIPDTDFPEGYRKNVIKINPHFKIIG